LENVFELERGERFNVLPADFLRMRERLLFVDEFMTGDLVSVLTELFAS
jgi:hypothetical protein